MAETISAVGATSEQSGTEFNLTCHLQQRFGVFRHSFSRLTEHALQNKPACHFVYRAVTQDSAGVRGKRGQRLLTRPPGKRCLNTTACRYKSHRERSRLSTHSEIYLVKNIINTIPPILTRRFSVPTGPYHKKQRHRNPGIYCTATSALRPYSPNVRPTVEPNIT